MNFIKKIQLLCFVMALIRAMLSPLYADQVTFKDGKSLSNVKVKIKYSAIYVQYRNGTSKRFPKSQLRSVKMRPVNWYQTARPNQPRPTPERTRPEESNPAQTETVKKAQQEELARVQEASVRGDTWQPRPEAEQVDPWNSAAWSLIPGYSGLYQTEATGGAIIFSIMETLLLVNALDFATATRDNHVWNRYDTLAGGIFLYDISQDGILIPGISGPALWYLTGGLTNQVTDMRGGLSRRRLMQAQAADFPPFNRQEQEFNRRKRQAYSMLALALVLDSLASYLSAADFNLGVWSGPQSTRPTTATGRGLRSLAMPGWGQIYSGQTTKGYAFGGVAAGLIVASGMQSYKFRRARQKYRSAGGDMLIYGGIGKLSGYSDEVGLIATSAIINPLRDEVSTEQSNYQKILGVTAAFWAYNVVDALLISSGSASGESTAGFSITPTMEVNQNRWGTAQSEERSAELSPGLQFKFRYTF